MDSSKRLARSNHFVESDFVLRKNEGVSWHVINFIFTIGVHQKSIFEPL